MLPLECWFSIDPDTKESVLYCYRNVFSHVHFKENPPPTKNKTVVIYTHYFDTLLIRRIMVEDLHDLYNKSNYDTLESFIYDFFVTHPKYIEDMNFTKTNQINEIMTEQELEHLELLQKLYM